MNSGPTPNNKQWRCDCHLKHSTKLEQIDKDTEKHEEEHIRVWDAMEKRVTNKFFIILVMLVVSMLGFQWVNYDKLSAMDKVVTEQIAIIKTKLDVHMTHNDKQYKLQPKTER